MSELIVQYKNEDDLPWILDIIKDQLREGFIKGFSPDWELKQ